ncbi:dihydroorotase [Peptococcaceae bacterium CEB3]|nr:dihydroorotase [Peptococcaceae bacterium CEB3]
MFISCSTKEELWPIPPAGKALIGGYWNPAEEPVQRPSVLEWAEGRILHLEDCPAGTLSCPPDWRDWREYLLMPGWIDAHVHLALDSIDFNLCLERWQDPPAMEAGIVRFLRRYRQLGICAIRDGGDLPGYGWSAHEKTAAGRWLGPEVISVREALYRRGRYGRFLGRGVGDIRQWREQREQFLSQGQAQVKLIVSGIISFREYGIVGAPQWSLPELREIVSDAHARGLAVMAHVSGTEAVGLALAAGVDTLEHGYYITSAQLEEMARRGVAWVPTVAPTGNILRQETDRYSADEKQVLTRIVQQHLTRVSEAHALGVHLGLGTDAGAYLVGHADSLLEEMAWFRQAGLPAREVCRLATEGNAVIIGRPELGRLVAGSAMANLQLRNTDNTDNYRCQGD